MAERIARPIRDENTGECLYCECDQFTEDVDMTVELLEEDGL